MKQWHRRGSRSTSVIGSTGLLLLAACGGSDAAPDAAQSDVAASARDVQPAATSTTTTGADPNAFAPKADVPEELDDSNARLRRMILEATEVPTRAEVGIPAYPGARVVQVHPPGSEQVNSVEALPLVWLISDDEPAKVAEFYRRELPDWNAGEFYLNSWFWSGQGQFDPLDTSGITTPSVGIMPPVPGRTDMFPGTSSEIQVRYQPGS
jgi:hypothetical protein